MSSTTGDGLFSTGLLSPNLGCPQILSLSKIKLRGKGIAEQTSHDLTAIFAASPQFAARVDKELFDYRLFLQSSYPTTSGPKKIPLTLAEDPLEILQWNKIAPFRTLDEWRTLIPDELHYNVLGEGTRYWQLRVKIAYQAEEDLLGPGERTRLFDLVWQGVGSRQEVNYHSIQIVRDFSRCRFYQLTDLHTARRNDEILHEILQDGAGKDAEKRYVNFNQHLRKAIYYVNQAAAAGEIDFVLLSGDLVDFANHGWSYDVVEDDNNWTNFFDIVIGRGREAEMPVGVEEGGKPQIGNPGLRVAIFTSTGNHDWRLYPYNPKGKGMPKIFGLTEEEMLPYNYKSFDSSEYPDDPRTKVVNALKNRALEKLNLEALTTGTFKWVARMAKTAPKSVMVSTAFERSVVYLLSAALAGSPLLSKEWHQLATRKYAVWITVLGLILFLIIAGFERLLKRGVDLIVENPLDAGSKALHFYLRHINPYIDYVYSFGRNYFVVMDSGSDVNTGQILDPRSLEKIKKMSLEDNVIGGSPDSMAFDARKIYYSWSQIVWLETVLECIGRQPDSPECVILAVHAPPINLGKEVTRASLFEDCHKGRTGHAWISDADYILTYGTINNYLSEFFYLCLGLKEYECRRKRRWSWWQNWLYRLQNWLSRRRVWPDPYRGRQELDNKCRALFQAQRESFPVDLVLCGHTHRLMEFRLWLDTEYEILIYSGFYSQEYSALPADRRRDWWQKRRPVIVQTPACGPNSDTDLAAPYFRRILIENGLITDFSLKSWQLTERSVILTSGDKLIPGREAAA